MPLFLFAALAPCEIIPNCVLLILLLIKELLLFPVPKVPVEIVEEPEPTPTNVVVLLLPTRLQFLIVLLVAAGVVPVAAVCNQITALEVPVLVCIKVKSLDADEAGQTVLAVLFNEPSMITLSAPFILIKPPAFDPVTERATPVGFIVTVKPVANSFSAFVPNSPVISDMILAVKLLVTTPLLIASKRPPVLVIDV